MSVCLPSIFHLCRRGIQHGPTSLFNDREYPPPSTSKPSRLSSWLKLASAKSYLFKGSFKSSTNRSAGSSGSTSAPCEKCGHTNTCSNPQRNVFGLKKSVVISTVDSLDDLGDTKKSVDRSDLEHHAGRPRISPPLAAVPQMWPPNPPSNRNYTGSMTEKPLPNPEDHGISPVEGAWGSRSVGAGSRRPSNHSPYSGSNNSASSPTWSNSPTSPTGYRKVPPWHHRACVRNDGELEHERHGDDMA